MTLDLNPDRRRLAEFSIALGAVALTIAGVGLWRGGSWTAAAAWAGGGVGLALVAFFVEPLGRTLYRGAMLVTWPIGLVVSHVLMALIYFVVLLPLGALRRLGGRDPLHRGFDAKAASYWTTRPPREGVGRYFRQY